MLLLFCNTFDGNAFLGDFAEAIREKLKANDRNVPHLKILSYSEDGDMCKLSLLGVDYDIQIDKCFKIMHVDLPVIINARAACESQLLDGIMDEALDETLTKYNLECFVFFTECFGMVDEGRI